MIMPVTQWVRRVAQRIIYPIEPSVIANAAAMEAGNLTMMITTPGSLVKPTTETTSGMPGIETDTSTILSGHTTLPVISYNTQFANHSTTRLPRSLTMDNNNNTLSSNHPPPFEPTSMTMQTTTLVQDPKKLHQEEARYFTFDGEHRKFYLAARYLRSAQRQRRLKRRVAQHVREQARYEHNRMQNTLSYGQLNENTRKKHTQDHRAYAPDSLQEQTLDVESLSSDSSNATGIQLICWKDIDLDLEVRSIDDESELARLAKTSRTGGAPIAKEPDVIVKPCHKLDMIRHGDTKRAYYTGKTYQTPTSDNSQLTTWTGESSIVPSKSTTIALADPETSFTGRRSRTLQISEPITYSTQTISVYDDTSQGLSSFTPLTQRPIPASRQDLSKRSTDYNPKGTITGTFGPLTEPTPGGLFPNRNRPTLPTANSLPLRVLKCPRGTENDHIQSIIHSTIIPNPMALEHMRETSMDKARPEGKSRLSLASSMGDLNSDLQIQLSYYSHEGAKTEEDMSFFSFGDGFSSDEDISQVTVPISLSLLIMTTYIIIGAVVFSTWEDKKYLKWSYFCFITLSTIGFGDIVPGTKIDSQNTKEKMAIISLYVAIGLSVFAMCFKLMQEEVVAKVKWFANKVGIMKQKRRHEKSL